MSDLNCKTVVTATSMLALCLWVIFVWLWWCALILRLWSAGSIQIHFTSFILHFVNPVRMYSAGQSLFLVYSQIYDVFTEKTMTLKDSTSFVVSVNPTGVVMWYVSAPSKRNIRQFYRGGRLQGSLFDDDENANSPVFLWFLTDLTLLHKDDLTLLHKDVRVSS